MLAMVVLMFLCFILLLWCFIKMFFASIPKVVFLLIHPMLLVRTIRFTMNHILVVVYTVK